MSIDQCSAVLMQVPLHSNVVIIPAGAPRENYLVVYLSSSTYLYFWFIFAVCEWIWQTKYHLSVGPDNDNLDTWRVSNHAPTGIRINFTGSVWSLEQFRYHHHHTTITNQTHHLSCFTLLQPENQVQNGMKTKTFY